MEFHSQNAMDRELVEFWHRIFSQPPEVFKGVFEAVDPKNRRTLVMRDGGSVAASVQVFAFDVRWPGPGSIRVGGIANVSTAPEHRRKGLGHGLLTRAIDTMRDMGCSFSLLYTGLDEFYGALGWRRLKRSTLRGTPASNDFGALGPGTAPDDPSVLQGAFEFANQVCPLTLIRSHSDWTKKIAPRLSDYLFFGSSNAYILAQKESGALAIVELGYQDATLGSGLLKGVSAWARAHCIAEIDLAIPVTPIVLEAASEALADLRWVEGSDGMIRVLDEGLTLEAVLGVCERQDAKFLRLDGF